MTPLVSFLLQNNKIGAIAPAIIDDDGYVQDSCRDYITPFSFVKRQINRILTKKEVVLDGNKDYSKIQTVDWLVGAFVIVTRKAYELTNGLETKYFLYVEDMDWSTRIRKAGFEIVYYPLVTITYKGTRSARNSSKYAKYFIQGLLRYWIKFAFSLPKRDKLIFENK